MLRAALIGLPSAGKTTLFRLMVGLEPADKGSITMPRQTTVGYLPQDGLAHAGKTLREEALSAFASVLALGAEIEKLEHRMAELDPDSPEHEAVIARYGECRDEWDRQGGFSIEARAEEVLLGLGFYMFHNTLQTNATQMAPEARGLAVSLFAFFLFIGQSIGVALAAPVVDHFGAPPIYLAAAVLMPLTALWFRRRLALRDPV